MRTLSHCVSATFILLAIALSACASGDKSVTPPDATSVITRIAAVSGTSITAVAGAAVTGLPSVVVENQRGAGMPGVAVTFAVVAGGGAITGSLVSTNASGIATVGSWTLGAAVGSNSLTASTNGLTPVTFTVSGIAGAPASAAKTAGDAQSVTAGSAVTTLPAILVRDANGNPVGGVSVIFAIAGGGGSVTGGTQTTNVAGIATVGGWTLGTAMGTNTLTATSASLTVVTFTATGVAGAASSLTKTAGDNQTAVVGAAILVAPSVIARDANGNAVSGASVTFTVASGGGTLTGATPTSNSSGSAAVGSWRMGPSPGANSLSASIAGGSAVTFSATSTPDPSSRTMEIAAGNNQTAATGTIVGIAPAVTIKDGNGNVVPGELVTFAVTAGGGSITAATATSNSSGKATVGSWTLGALGRNTLTASKTGVADVLFVATAVAPSPVVGIFPDVSFVNLPPSQRDPFDGTKITIVKTLLLPSNCPQTFAVANLGPPGSVMDYQVVNQDFVNGFVYENGTATLPAGWALPVRFSVHPDFVTNANGGPSSLNGSTQVLSIFTPQASNFVKTLLTVRIKSLDEALIGTWSGTWSGLSFGAGNLTSPVSGNWVLQVTAVDFVTGNVGGSLTWTGTDAVWSSNGMVASPLSVNGTQTFTTANSDVKMNPACGMVTIAFNKNFTDPPSSYGPNGILSLDLQTGAVDGASHFHANPTWPNGGTGLSSGKLFGSKTP